MIGFPRPRGVLEDGPGVDIIYSLFKDFTLDADYSELGRNL
jgi:hypothetical protein